MAESVRGLDEQRPTGGFFDEQSVAAIVAAVEEFERNEHRIEPGACRERALRFSSARFVAEYAWFVDRAWNAFSAGAGARGAGCPRARIEPRRVISLEREKITG